MSYFLFIAPQLSEIIISYLYVDDFLSFIKSNILYGSINWKIVYNYHFSEYDINIHDN